MNHGDQSSPPNMPPPSGPSGQPGQPVQPGQWNQPPPQYVPTLPADQPGQWSHPPQPGYPEQLPQAGQPGYWGPVQQPQQPQQLDPYWQQDASPPAASRRRKWKPLASILAVAIIAGAGIGIFLILNGREDSTPEESNWPANPQLQGSYPAAWRPDRNSGHQEPLVKGQPDNLYILNPGDSTTTVDHYVNGQLTWSVYVQGGVPLNIYNPLDGDPLILTGEADRMASETLTRLSSESGDVVWTKGFDEGEWPEFIDGRIFVKENTGDIVSAVVEYSYDTGAEINRLEDEYMTIEDDAILTARYDEGTAQRYNLDFQPVGQRITLEPSDFGYGSIKAATLGMNWVYYHDENVVVAGPDGTKLADCAPSIEVISSVTTTEDGIIVTRSFDEFEAFSFEGGVCRSIFARSGFREVYILGDYANFQDFLGLTAEFEYEVVDLATGEVARSSEGQVLVNNGYALTNADGKATLTNLADNTDVWTLDVPPDATLRRGVDMVVVITPNGNDATVEIYADNPSGN